MRNLLDLSQDELANLLSPKFRAKQIYEWVYKKNARSFDEMTNISKDVREKFEKRILP